VYSISQISGGKRYAGFPGTPQANATYLESHGVDTTTSLSFGLDMTALILEDGKKPLAFYPGIISDASTRK